jgi:ATP-binding cassette subfamily B protein
MAWSLYEVFSPYLFKSIINIIHDHADQSSEIFSLAARPLFLFLSARFFMECSLRFRGFMFAKTMPRLRSDVRKMMFRHIKQHSYRYFSTNLAGSLATHLNEISRSTERIIGAIINDFYPISIAFLLSVYTLWQVHYAFSLLIGCWSIAYSLLIFKFLGKKTLQHATVASASDSAVRGKIADVITNITNVQLFAQMEYEKDYIHPFEKEEVDKAEKFLKYVEIVKGIQALASLALVFTVFYTLFYFWSKQMITLGDFSFVSSLTLFIVGINWFLASLFVHFSEELGKLKQALSIIYTPHEIVDKPSAGILKVELGDIRFEEVCFGYSNSDQLLFDQLNVTIPSGQKVGLVGYSGSGKSTFINLILRNFDVSGGRVLIDEQDISVVTQASLRDQIAMIPQEALLFHRTLMENLRYGTVGATEVEVIEAAKRAHCHEFIAKMPQGYQTLVGDQGTKLSGGQRQRIAIARAFLKNAPILILDEATSALDSETELKIQESLEELMVGRTVLIVAHRLSTLSNVDRILVFQEGKIVEDGSIEELFEQNGLYARLWMMQQRGVVEKGRSSLFT